MNASELNRKLLFCGYSDLTDYLRNSPLNRYIYKQLLAYSQQVYISPTILALFNEIYYQCVRVRYDGNPGMNMEERYFRDGARWLESKYSSRLVFCIVWVLFQLRRELSFREECFFEQLSEVIGSFDHFEFATKLLTGMKAAGMVLNDEFPTMTCPISDIPMHLDTETKSNSRVLEFFYSIIYSETERLESDFNTWRKLTDNFSHSLIESYVKLYSKPDDQIALLKRIQAACPPKERSNHEEFFLMLINSITSGNYNLVINRANSRQVSTVCDSQEEYDRMFAAGLKQTEEEALNDKEEQYKQERDTLKYQLEQLKKNYEADLERLEAKYQDEISALKDDLAKAATSQVKVENQKAVPPKELSLTISEIATDAKTWFHESGASELTNMLYRFARKQQNMDEDLWKLIDSIIPAVEQ